MGSIGLAKAMDGLSWGLVGAVGWVVPAPSWPSPPAEMLAGEGLALGRCPGVPPALWWASSFSKTGTDLRAPLNIYLGPKALLCLGPTVPCWLDLGTLSGG